MPSDLLVEEWLDASLALSKRQLVRLFKLVASPDGGSTPVRTPPAAAGGAGANKTGKTGKTTRAPKSSAATLPSASASSSSRDHSVPAPSIEACSATLTLLLERMAYLGAHGLSDSHMHHLTQLGLHATFGIDGLAVGTARARECVPLHMAGMRLLLAIFAEHPALRRAIATEVLDARVNATLTAHRDARRNYALSDGGRVQMFTALVLLLIQSAAAVPRKEDKDDGKGAAAGAADAEVGEEGEEGDGEEEEEEEEPGRGRKGKRKSAAAAAAAKEKRARRGGG